jgi:hypothetical protein
MSTDCPVIRCALWSAGRASCVDVNAAAAGPASFASSSTGFSTHDTMGTGSRRTAASFAAHLSACRDVAAPLTPTVICALMT